MRVDAGGVAESRVDVGDDAHRIGAAVGEFGHALHELDRLAEQPLLECPRTVRRPEHQRSLEHVTLRLRNPTSQPLRPGESPISRLSERTCLVKASLMPTCLVKTGCGKPPSDRRHSAAVALRPSGAGMTPARRRRLVEFERLDAPAALGDLVGRDEDLRHVLVGLPEMLLQVQHALAQAPEIDSSGARPRCGSRARPRACAHPSGSAASPGSPASAATARPAPPARDRPSGSGRRSRHAARRRPTPTARTSARGPASRPE